MKKALLLFISLTILSISEAFSIEAPVKNDNGQFGSAPVHTGWEESVFLKPDGPCKIKSIQIYYTGTKAGKDTVYIVGDPAEGAVSPTFWVLKYNTRASAIYDYDGIPGWKTIPVSGEAGSDGFDRIVIQHRQYENGPLWGIDNNGMAFNYSSMYVNPFATNSLGGPGAYSIPSGDFMVRLSVEYTYPAGLTSLSAPAPKLLDVTQQAGLTRNGELIKAGNVAVVDWNNDGYDDLNFGSLFFQNNRNGTFKDAIS
jgi:hypothetical protein